MAVKKIRNNNSANKKLYLLFLIVLFCDLIFLYINKYYSKKIPITEFTLINIGNILNLVFFLFPAVGLIYLFFHPGLMNKQRYYLLLVLIVILNVPLLFYALSTRINIPISFAYFFSYQIDKVYDIFLFLIHQGFLLFLSFIIWLTIFKKERRLYLLSMWYSVLTVIILVIISVIYISTFYDEKLILDKPEKKADVAVILGAAVWSKDRPSPIFASRIGKALNLYNSGLVKKIQVTGSNAPGEISEAKVAYNLLRKYGVNSRDIWIEENTSSTYDQVAFIKKTLVDEKKLDDILIISDQFHLKRVMEICKFFKVKARGISSDLKLSWEKFYFYRFRDGLALLLFWLFAF